LKKASRKVAEYHQEKVIEQFRHNLGTVQVQEAQLPLQGELAVN
jgi:ribosomal protein S17E